MNFLCVWMITSIFQTVVDVKQMSRKDRLKRMKYTGVWIWESEMVLRTMSRFPSTVTRRLEKTSTKMTYSNPQSSENPRNRNSDCILFSKSMWLMWLTKKEREKIWPSYVILIWPLLHIFYSQDFSERVLHINLSIVENPLYHSDLEFLSCSAFFQEGIH
jgi:hypothetical protein